MAARGRFVFPVLVLAVAMGAASSARAEPAHDVVPGAADALPADDDFWLELGAQASRLAIAPAKTARASAKSAAHSGALDWSRSDKPDGSAALTAKQALPLPWETRLGVDLGLAPPVRTQPLEPWQPSAASSGTAWASTSVPALAGPMGWDRAAIEARIDPARESGKLGTVLNKSVPLGERFSLTLQNGYAASGTLAGPDAAPLVPTPSGASSVYSTEGLAKLNILPSGTSFSTGGTLSSADEKWLGKVGIEQKLFGGIRINGTLSETATGVPSKSLTAGFKRTW